MGIKSLPKLLNEKLSNSSEGTEVTFILKGLSVIPMSNYKDFKALSTLILKEKTISIQLKLFKKLLGI